ncbi:MAG: NADH-quinone oxidoreductase subunit H, partial [Bacteroidales bacterium]|nr:NADH-quinone oxidoreductase subunit H [Bacteroidales bacterium]
LSLGKFFNISAALDTGSSFEGMGASREALFSMLVEPAFFLLIGSLGLLTGHTSFASIFGMFHLGSSVSYAFAIISAFVLLMICMIENSRMPVDDPKTHLELTMIHEVMILDNSGFDLGLIMQATHSSSPCIAPSWPISSLEGWPSGGPSWLSSPSRSCAPSAWASWSLLWRATA